MDLHLVAVDPRGNDAQRLLAALTAEISRDVRRQGQDGTGGFALADLEVPRAVFVVAYADGEPVGCGALRPYEDDIAEVKRMYTVPHGGDAASQPPCWPSSNGTPARLATPPCGWKPVTGSRAPSACTSGAATATSRRLDRTSRGTTASVSRSR